MVHQHDERLARADLSLRGLSVGDAFGERFFAPPDVFVPWLEQRVLDLPAPWRWTDDTAMALAIVSTLRDTQGIDPDVLSAKLAVRYRAEPWRGYGGGAHRLFDTMAAGTPWRNAAASLFGNQGSFGNGAAMRVAPVGAYFAEDLDACVEAADRSAIVTHAHAEGRAGAIAIAVAAAVAHRTRNAAVDEARAMLWSEVLQRTPTSAVRTGLERARATELDANIETAVRELGNGSGISAQDTVPLCLWAIAGNLRDYEAALWRTVAGMGDRDTTCAIVGGVVALSAPEATLPSVWLDAREPLEGLPPPA